MLHTDEIPLFLEKIEDLESTFLPFCLQPIENKELRTHCLSSSSLGIVLKNHSSGQEWETFLEAMTSGLPLAAPSSFLAGVVPESTVILIPPHNSKDFFPGLVHRALTDPSLRKVTSEAAFAWINAHHSLEAAAYEVRKLIERWCENWVGLTDDALATSLSTYLEEIPRWNRRREAEKLSWFTANSEPLLRPERLYIDLTSFMKSIKKGEMTGIQRVIRNLFRFLPIISSTPVYTFRIGKDRGNSFFLSSLPTDPTLECLWKTSYSLSLRPGDKILFPDTLLDTEIYDGFLEYCRSRGAHSLAIVYDLLPVRLPQCFTTSHADNFRRWLEITLTKSNSYMVPPPPVGSDSEGGNGSP